jgi:hypothetical protein
LVFGGDRERRHHHHEDEEVVDGQALFDDVAGEVLAAVVPSGDEPEHDAEYARHGDVEDRRDDRLAEADLAGVAGPRDEQVEHEQDADCRDGRCPSGEAYVEHRLTLTPNCRPHRPGCAVAPQPGNICPTWSLTARSPRCWAVAVHLSRAERCRNTRIRRKWRTTIASTTFHPAMHAARALAETDRDSAKRPPESAAPLGCRLTGQPFVRWRCAPASAAWTEHGGAEGQMARRRDAAPRDG